MYIECLEVAALPNASLLPSSQAWHIPKTPLLALCYCPPPHLSFFSSTLETHFTVSDLELRFLLV